MVSSVTAGIIVIQRAKRPPIETKFVQNSGNSNITPPTVTKNETDNLNEKVVPIKSPGDFVLVENPNHTYQTFNNCGPATLSMILSFYGKRVDQKELGDLMRPYQVKSGDNDDKTIFTYEFSEWAKKYGLESSSRVNGNIELLKTFTSNGFPVVVKTWLHVGEDIGHFRIVRGFDEKDQVIIQDDSYEGPNKKIKYFDFLSMWQPFNYTYIVVYTPDQKDLVDAIISADLDEKTSWENTLKRAEEEANLDPENIYPIFNKVTSYYHLGDYQKSVQSFESVENKLPKRMLWYQIEPILAYFELENYDRVFEITEKILSNGNRAFSELYMIRGDIYKKQGKTNEARAEYEKAVLYNNNLEEAKKALNSV